jgi:hypothetical protein
MTRSTPREMQKPVEEVARALCASKAWPAVFAAGSATVLAQAAITRLRELGFINDIGLAALKAEGDTTQGEQG